MYWAHLFILVVATANLCLGYFVAVRLGYGPTISPWASIALRSLRPAVHTAEGAVAPSVVAAPSAPAVAKEAQPTAPAESKRDSSTIGALDCSHNDQEKDVVALRTDDDQNDLQNNAPDRTAEDPIDEAGEDAPAAIGEEAIDDEAPDDIPDDFSPFEASYRGVRRGMTRFSTKVGKFEKQLRSFAGSTPDISLRSLAGGINHVAYDLLDQLSTTLQPMMQSDHNNDDLAAPHQHVHQVVGELTLKFNSILAGITAMKFDEESPSDASARLMKACEKLLVRCHAARDAFGDPLADIARQIADFDQLRPGSYSDEQTGLADRLGLEVALADWRREDPNQERPISIGIIDCDAMGELNCKQGSLIGDSLLSAVAKMIETAVDEKDKVVRVSGQQFLLLCPDTPPTSAAQTMEMLRQSIEKTRFQVGGDEFRVTVSAAVIPGQKDEISAALLERLRDTVGEAKSYGRNRTFLREDEGPTPVVPPELQIGEQVVAL